MGRVRQYIPDEIDRATRKMTKGRTTDIDDVLIDMLPVTARVGIWWRKRWLKICMREVTVPEVLRTALIDPVWKRKGDRHAPGKCRVIILRNDTLNRCIIWIGIVSGRAVMCVFFFE